MKRVLVCVFLLWVWVLARPVLAEGDSAGEARRVWNAYQSSVGGSSENSDDVRRDQIRQFETLLAYPELQWEVTARTLNEIGALHGSIGETDKAVAAFERLYEESVKRGDIGKKRLALSNLVDYSKYPRTREQMTKAVACFAEYQRVLTDPSVSHKKRYQQWLADSFFGLGEMYLREKEFYGELGESERKQYYAEAAEALRVFVDIGQFESNSHASGLLMLGTAHEKVGDRKAAAVAFRAIADLPEPTVARSYAMLRAIQAEYPERQDRIGPMEGVLEELPRDRYADAFKQQLLFEYLNAELWEEAIRIASEITNTPEGDDVNAYNLFLLATALRRSGRVDEAADVLAALVGTYPDTTAARDLATRELRILRAEARSMGLDVTELDLSLVAESVPMAVGRSATKQLGVADAAASDGAQGIEEGGGEQVETAVDSRGAFRGKGRLGSVVLVVLVMGCALWVVWRFRRGNGS